MKNNLETFVKAIIKNGGATYHLPTGRMQFKDGYFVSLKDHESMSDVSSIRSQIATYIKENGFTLSQEDHYLGAWIENGHLFLDVSVLIDDKDEALAYGKKMEQLAIRDNRRGVNIYL